MPKAGSTIELFPQHSERVAVVIPCYRVRNHILDVLKRIGPEVHAIYVVDDCCPEASGKLVESFCDDPRVQVLFHRQNQGVGGAMVTGYRRALQDNCDVVVKIDGDGQMAPELIPMFVGAVLSGQADYSKGNRFYNLESLSTMPAIRLFGNSILSFVNKVPSGYWDIMDPTNGFTAIHAEVLRLLPLDKLDKRYFFESDMLFRLGTIRAVVRDIPMDAVYQDEQSSLRLRKVLFDFPLKFVTRSVKRIVYSYFLRDFNAASLQLVTGLLLLALSAAYAVYWWFAYASQNAAAPFGTVMVPTIAIILGIQLLLSAISIDIQSVPREPLHKAMVSRRRVMREAGASDEIAPSPQVGNL